MLRKLKTFTLILCGSIVVFAFSSSYSGTSNALTLGVDPGQQKLDPAAWGSDHVGKPVPEYVTGDECLFCHRNDIGPAWQKNAHGITLRDRNDAPALLAILKSQPAIKEAEVEYFLGSRNRLRFLKKAGYGKFAIHGSQAALNPDKTLKGWIDLDKQSWDADRFARNCAGCHTTAVDPKTQSFGQFGLDCYTCHGVVDLDHTSDVSKVFLSKKNSSNAKAITSMCASCHLRGGKSKASGLPYANNFVPGDNLFKDFAVDFAKADDETLNPGDRHVYQNVRDVVLNGIEFPTCISCHAVHENSTVKHRRAPRNATCAGCHEAEGTIKGSKPYVVKSPLCEY